jgi:hypothetical protein
VNVIVALAVALGAAATLVAVPPAAVADDAAKTFDKKKAEKSLKEALTKRDLEAVDAIGREMRSLTGTDATDALELLLKVAKDIPPTEDQLYWHLVRAAALFHDKGALDALGEFVLKNKKTAFARDIVFSLQDNQNKTAIPMLARILEEAPFDLQLLAIDRLAGIKSVESVDALIAAYQREKRPNDITARLDRALRGLTGADLGNANDWAKWWEVERSIGLAKRDERSGSGTVTDDLDRTRHSELEELQ